MASSATGLERGLGGLGGLGRIQFVGKKKSVSIRLIRPISVPIPE